MEDVVVSGLAEPIRASRATSFLDRLLGLRSSGSRPSLFMRASSVHTFGMKTPIAVVGLDAGLRVIGAREVSPGRVVWFRRARYVLEMPSGTSLPASGTQIRLGDG